MPAAVPVITAVSGVATVAGTLYSINQQKKAARAQEASLAAQQQQQALQVRRSQRAAIRQRQLQQAQLQAGALGMGVTGGSALAGGGASLASQTGEALGFGSQMSGLSRQITMFNQQAVDYGTRAQTGQAIAGLGSQAFSSLGGFSTLFPTATGVGAPNPAALLRGVG